MYEFAHSCANFMQINLNMLEIPIIQKPLDNHIEFEWKFKFLMKNYENVCWHGGNSSYLMATRLILTFAPCWIWCQIHFLLENLWTYMKTWLKYALFGGHQMVFVPQPIEFGVKFRFLLKFYVITWKDGWNTSYLVATKWVLFPNVLSLVSNSIFCWKFMQLHEKMVEICLIWWPLYVFWPPLVYWIKSWIKLKFEIN
jgi:hypothetical protein